MPTDEPPALRTVPWPVRLMAETEARILIYRYHTTNTLMWLAEMLMKLAVVRLSGRRRLAGWVAHAGIAVGMAALRIRPHCLPENGEGPIDHGR